MNKPLTNIWGLFLVLLISSCTSQKIGFKGVKYPHFKTFETPRTGHPPGYVFRIRNGETKPIPVTIIDASKSIVAESEDFPEYYTDWSAKSFLNFLFPNIAKANSELDKKIYTSLKIKNGKRETVFEDALKKLIIAKQIDFKDDSRYFVIQETISTTDIDYSISKKSKLDLSVEEQIKELEAQGKITVTGDKQYQIKQKYKEPHRVFYSLLEINKSGPLIAGEKDILLLKVNENIIVPNE